MIKKGQTIWYLDFDSYIPKIKSDLITDVWEYGFSFGHSSRRLLRDIGIDIFTEKEEANKELFKELIKMKKEIDIKLLSIDMGVDYF